MEARLVGAGVDDREGDVPEGPAERSVQGLAEELGDEPGVVGEVAAAPGAQHEGVVAIGCAVASTLTMRAPIAPAIFGWSKGATSRASQAAAEMNATRKGSSSFRCSSSRKTGTSGE